MYGLSNRGFESSCDYFEIFYYRIAIESLGSWINWIKIMEMTQCQMTENVT